MAKRAGIDDADHSSGGGSEPPAGPQYIPPPPPAPTISAPGTVAVSETSTPFLNEQAAKEVPPPGVDRGAGTTSSQIPTNYRAPVVYGSADGGTKTQESANQTAAEQKALDNLNSDVSAGQKYTTDSGAFSNGAMGRVSDTTDAATADALAKARGLEQGLSAPQMRAEKELNDQSIGGQLQSNLMQLRGIQGAQGLRGASAAAQQMGLGYNALAQQQTAARQESLDQLAAQQSGVQNFLSDNQANNAFNTGNKQYNNQQANAEAAGRLSTPLTYAGLLQGVRTGADANIIAQEGADTASTSADAAIKNAIAQTGIDASTARAANIQAENDQPT